MDILDEDLLRFRKSLSGNKVEYMMIGVFVVNMHGYVGATQDVNIWIKDDKANRHNLGNAMAAFGYEELSWEDIQFVPGGTKFNIW